MAAEHHITIHRGAAYQLDVALENPDGTPLDPTGGTFGYQIADKRGDEALIETDPGDLVAVQASGEETWTVSITLTAEQTASLAPGTYYHELYFVDSDGRPSVLLYGGVGVTEAQVASLGS